MKDSDYIENKHYIKVNKKKLSLNNSKKLENTHIYQPVFQTKTFSLP